MVDATGAHAPLAVELGSIGDEAAHAQSQEPVGVSKRRRLVGKQAVQTLKSRRYDLDFWGVAGGKRKAGRKKVAVRLA